MRLSASPIQECQGNITNLIALIENTVDDETRKELEYQKDVLFAELYLLQYPEAFGIDDGETF